MRVCAECPAVIESTARGGRCTGCRRRHDRERGSRADRGYGTEHQAERAQWQARMAVVTVYCWRCSEPVDPTDWHLGHDDVDRSITRGPEHPLCNLRAAGRNRSKGGG